MDTVWALIITAAFISLSSLFGDKQEIKEDKDNTNILPPELYKRKKGKCCFCNEKVSRREFYHQNCIDIYLDGKSRLLGLSSSLLSDEMNIDNFDNVIEDIKANNYIKLTKEEVASFCDQYVYEDDIGNSIPYLNGAAIESITNLELKKAIIDKLNSEEK